MIIKCKICNSKLRYRITCDNCDSYLLYEDLECIRLPGFALDFLPKEKKAKIYHDLGNFRGWEKLFEIKMEELTSEVVKEWLEKFETLGAFW